MKLKSWLLICCLSLVANSFANTRLITPEGSSNEAQAPGASKKIKTPGYCEIEIINYSGDDLWVWGRVSNGLAIKRFFIPQYDAPHSWIIDLFDYNFSNCPAGMLMYIDTLENINILADFVKPGATVRILPRWNKTKAEIQMK